MTAKIKLNSASGGGSFSLQAPSSSSNNRVMTLPDTADGTILTTTNPKTGNILQVVYGETTSVVSDTSGNFVDSGVTATITPSSTSNKVMVIVSMQWFLFREATETNGSFKLLRGSTAISTRDNCIHIEAGTTSQSRIISEGGYTIQRLDSPSTTSATTYKVQFLTAVTANAGQVTVSKNSAPSCITLMEVAA